MVKVLLACGLFLDTGCASGPAPAAVPGSAASAREVPWTCPRGPHCVAGEVNDLFGNALPGVRCIVRTAAGPPGIAQTDSDGFFLIDGLEEAPSFLQLEGGGVAAETLRLPQPGVGQAARVFAVLAPASADSQESAKSRR